MKLRSTLRRLEALAPKPEPDECLITGYNPATGIPVTTLSSLGYEIRYDAQGVPTTKHVYSSGDHPLTPSEFRRFSGRAYPAEPQQHLSDGTPPGKHSNHSSQQESPGANDRE